MISGSPSFKKKLFAIFAPAKPLTEISQKLRAAFAKKIKDEKILHCLKVEKIFYKTASSFSGETFFHNVAIITDERLVVVKDSSSYSLIKSFPLAIVLSCDAQSDSGKPALSVEFSDKSHARLVFAFDDPETEIFEKTLNRARSNMGKSRTGGAFCSQCGNKSRPSARFCYACGARLDFIVSENTMNEE